MQNIPVNWPLAIVLQCLCLVMTGAVLNTVHIHMGHFPSQCVCVLSLITCTLKSQGMNVHMVSK